MSALRRIPGRALLLAASLACATPALALADSEHAAAEAHGGGHDQPLTLHEIVAGDQKWEFWGAVFNFTLLVYLIVLMAKRPTRVFLQTRRSTIERGIKEAAEAKAKAEAIQHEYSERMKSLDKELNKLRSDIAANAAEERARIVAEAEESAARVKAETEVLVARHAEQLEADIRREVVEAAIKAAEAAVRQAATADDQRRMADTFAQELARLSVEKRA